MSSAEIIAHAKKRGVTLGVILDRLRFRRDRRWMLSALSVTVLFSRQRRAW
jgi:hypothetical protein